MVFLYEDYKPQQIKSPISDTRIGRERIKNNQITGEVPYHPPFRPVGPHSVIEEIGGGVDSKHRLGRTQYWPTEHKSPGIVDSQWYPWQTTIEEV